MPRRSKKRKSSVSNAGVGRKKRQSKEADTESKIEEEVDPNAFSFMKTERGRPKKKKKASLVRARCIHYGHEIPTFAKNDLEKTHSRLASMRRYRSKHGGTGIGSIKFWFYVYLFMSILAYQIYDGYSRYESIKLVARNQRTSASRLAPKYDYFMKTKTVVVCLILI